MSFQKLLAELDELQLAKSEPIDGSEDDEAIEAAASDGEEAGEDADDGAEVAGDTEGDEDGDEDGDESFGKSLRLTLDDGTEIDAIDGTEMIKSLQGEISALNQRYETDGADMLKAMNGVMDLVKSLNSTIEVQGEQIKRLSEAGRGRKAVVSINERQDNGDLAKSQGSEPDGMTADAFMAKALDAQKNGRISGNDVAVAEGYLIRGQSVPAHIVNRVLG